MYISTATNFLLDPSWALLESLEILVVKTSFFLCSDLEFSLDLKVVLQLICLLDESIFTKQWMEPWCWRIDKSRDSPLFDHSPSDTPIPSCLKLWKCHYWTLIWHATRYLRESKLRTKYSWALWCHLAVLLVALVPQVCTKSCQSCLPMTTFCSKLTGCESQWYIEASFQPLKEQDRCVNFACLLLWWSFSHRRLDIWFGLYSLIAAARGALTPALVSVFL